MKGQPIAAGTENVVLAFTKESDLCGAFIEAVRKAGGWTVYPETAGFDILLVRDDGFQIGIEAKLRLNAKVICQAVKGEFYYSTEHDGPDCFAVMIPDGSANRDLISLAKHLGVTVIRMRGGPGGSDADFIYNDRFTPRLPDRVDPGYWFGDDWFERAPLTRCIVPAYMPDVEAGKPCPVCLTPWKIKAIKLTILLERRGYVSRNDFKHLELSVSRWTQGQWIAFGALRGQWIAGPNMPDFRAQHPISFAEIEADFEAWKPVEAAP